MLLVVVVARVVLIRGPMELWVIVVVVPALGRSPTPFERMSFLPIANLLVASYKEIHIPLMVVVVVMLRSVRTMRMMIPDRVGEATGGWLRSGITD